MKKILLLFSLCFLTIFSLWAVEPPTYDMSSTSSMSSFTGTSQLSNGGYSQYGQPFAIGAEGVSGVTEVTATQWEEEGDDPGDWDEPSTTPVGDYWCLLAFLLIWTGVVYVRRRQRA